MSTVQSKQTHDDEQPRERIAEFARFSCARLHFPRQNVESGCASWISMRHVGCLIVVESGKKRYAGRKRSGTNEKGNKPAARKSTTILMLRPKLCVFTGVVLNTVLVRFMRWKGGALRWDLIAQFAVVVPLFDSVCVGCVVVSGSR